MAGIRYSFKHIISGLGIGFRLSEQDVCNEFSGIVILMLTAPELALSARIFRPLLVRCCWR